MTRKYTKDHEWISVDGDNVTVGITEHAAAALGELVYVELPEVGDKFGKGDSAIVVESSKSASDVYMPVSGEVIAVNEELVSSPESVNNSPYEDGWLVKVKAEGNVASETAEYFDEAGYEAYLAENN
ncbi:MAG: glycine cleavage system protein GcvH [Proteobacteria bacterium]|nr:glycine cleavage system protein GcvH [Pseudomonadota bacterium]